MVSRRSLLGVLGAGLAAPAIAWAEGLHVPELPAVTPKARKARRVTKALATQPADKAALDKAVASVPPMEGEEGHAAPGATQVSGVKVEPPAPAVSPDEALGRLKHGNAIFARGGASLVLPSAARISEMAGGQKPFAVIVGCSDSRTAPELIFDCNLGELFIVRVAGSTVGPEGLGSILYAVEHLGAPLVVVLGHTKCGAVGAAVDVATKHAHLHGALQDMVLPILPAVFDAESEHPSDLQDAAIRRNVRNTAARLKVADGTLAERVAQGRLKIISACYDLSTAQVKFDV
ncbi:carbonic anhydrase [Caulobacter sp. D4A]|uniref:carbonic anhydrase n=1 Tax=unclassified Caulobacter TaxID=2648921 RepID=UPI000D72E2D3|nr:MULTISPECIES: carbonic anhydrase [unclassified Caulobacter]PXA70566.1 carbonic anhydrase [Caulobacter sp. D4A]PXA90784.1 carbonic anhydrase [Caulobacter sp. D5]